MRLSKVAVSWIGYQYRRTRRIVSSEEYAGIQLSGWVGTWLGAGVATDAYRSDGGCDAGTI